MNDFITLTFIESRKKSAEHYRIGVGDRLQIEWLQGAGNTELPLNRELLVQPDGTVTLPLIGEVNASGKTINDFRDEVVKLYSKYQRDPQITVTPMSVNVAVQDRAQSRHLEESVVRPDTGPACRARRHDPGRRHRHRLCSRSDARRTAQ